MSLGFTPEASALHRQVPITLANAYASAAA